MKTIDFINSFNLISHTEPDRKLVVHLDEVYKKAKSRFDELCINFDVLNISKDEFEELLKIVSYCHDFGKTSKYFQEKLKRDKVSQKQKRLSEHGLISAFFGYFVATLKFDKRLASFVFMAIRYHHLNLDNSKEMQKVKEDDIDNVLDIFEGIKANSEEIDRIYHHFLEIENITSKFEQFLENSFPEDELEYLVMYFWYGSDYEDNDIFIFMLLFSLLIYADKQDAIFRDKELFVYDELTINSSKVEEFKDAYFENRDKTPLDKTREKIYQSLIDEFNNDNISSKKLFFVKLPTGAGKTLLLYKLAMMIYE